MRNDYGTFESSPFTDYVVQLSLDTSYLDDEVGTVEYGPGWFGRLGKRVLGCDDRGFYSLTRFPTEQDAIDAMEDIAEEYARIDLPEEVVACESSGVHLTSCDEDGYCNACGHQESSANELENA